jgi:hypothetical protein
LRAPNGVLAGRAILIVEDEPLIALGTVPVYSGLQKNGQCVIDWEEVPQQRQRCFAAGSSSSCRATHALLCR